MLVLPRLRPIFAGILALCVGVALTTWQANIAVASDSGNVLYGESASSFTSNPSGIGPIRFSPKCNGKAYWVAKRNQPGLGEGLVQYSVAMTAKCASDISSIGNRQRIVRYEGSTVDANPRSCSFTGRVQATGGGGIIAANWTDKSVAPPAVAGYAVDPGYSGGITPILPGLDPSPCHPTRIYVTGSSGTWYEADIDLGPLPTFGSGPVYGETCPYGRPDHVGIIEKTRTILGKNRQVYEIDIEAISDPFQGTSWRAEAVFGPKNPPYGTKPYVQQPQGLTAKGVNLSAGTGRVDWNPDGNNEYSYLNDTGSTWGYIGVQVFRRAGNETDNSKTSVGLDLQRYDGASLWGRDSGKAGSTSLNQSFYYKGFGDTNPGICSFWFGPKVFEDEDSAFDEPYGSATPPIGAIEEPTLDGVDDPTTDPSVGEPDEACNFDIMDPASWVSGGVCALVGMIKTLIDAIVAIPAAIFALVETLLIPDPSTWGFDELVGQFEARPPGSVVMSVGQAAKSGADSYSGSGSCSLFTIEGASVTCDSVKEVPGYSALYSLVQLALISLTGLAIFRIFAGSFSDESGG